MAILPSIMRLCFLGMYHVMLQHSGYRQIELVRTL